MHGPVRVPDEAGAGKAKLTFSFGSWKAARVAPSTVEIPIVEPPAVALFPAVISFAGFLYLLRTQLKSGRQIGRSAVTRCAIPRLSPSTMLSRAKL